MDIVILLFQLKNLNSKILNGKTITVIGYMSHTHLSGREIYTKIVKNGTEIDYLARNKYYDFHYQNTIFLEPYKNITDVKILIFLKKT